jgi:hypothetical protein
MGVVRCLVSRSVRKGVVGGVGVWCLVVVDVRGVEGLLWLE